MKPITATTPVSSTYFGCSVAIDGDFAIVGAFFEGTMAGGGAFVFGKNEGSEENWGVVEGLTASNEQFGDLYGYSVGISGDYAIIGAPSRNEEEPELSLTGLAYIIGNLEALPVTLTDFKVKKEHSTSQLTWVTTSEVNSSRFEVEHSQTGKTWRTVGTVTSKGASDYSFTDKEPWNGNNYYRLKMVDLDGTYAYSKIRSVRFDLEAALYPNPVSDRIQIKDIDWNSVKQVQFYNSKGIIVLESKKIPSTGIDVGRISSGNYTAHLTYNNGIAKSFKIIKE